MNINPRSTLTASAAAVGLGSALLFDAAAFRFSGIRKRLAKKWQS
jgi:hypothetical protein